MTKQEEIREGIKKFLQGTAHNGYYDGLEVRLLEELHSQDVVIRVDRELPLIELLAEDLVEPIVNFYIPDDESRGYAFNVWEQVKKRLLKAGYVVAVESLI